MKKIEPKIDQYGNLSRASFFADYIEILTLKGRRSTRKLLKDLIEDNFAGKRAILTSPGESEDEDWSAGEYADEAWNCLFQRLEILGNGYPFEVTENRLRLRPDAVLRDSPYVGLLAVSLAHSFSASTDLRVETVFEEVVADAMAAVGLSVGRVGALSRQSPAGFGPTLQRLGAVMGIPTYPDVIMRRSSANDARVDVVGHLDWKDKRKGRWLYIGQVTCAQSDEWHRKITEPIPDEWMNFLGDIVPPVAFLAVPYHVEDQTIAYMSHIRRSVVDRLQLARNLEAVRPDLQPIIDEVLQADIQTFAVQ